MIIFLIFELYCIGTSDSTTIHPHLLLPTGPATLVSFESWPLSQLAELWASSWPVRSKGVFKSQEQIGAASNLTYLQSSGRCAHHSTLACVRNLATRDTLVCVRAVCCDTAATHVTLTAYRMWEGQSSSVPISPCDVTVLWGVSGPSTVCSSFHIINTLFGVRLRTHCEVLEPGFHFLSKAPLAVDLPGDYWRRRLHVCHCTHSRTNINIIAPLGPALQPLPHTPSVTRNTWPQWGVTMQRWKKVIQPQIFKGTRTSSQDKGQLLMYPTLWSAKDKYLTSRQSFETCLLEATEACFGLAQIAIGTTDNWPQWKIEGSTL
jgi:hypothetical protein